VSGQPKGILASEASRPISTPARTVTFQHPAALEVVKDKSLKVGAADGGSSQTLLTQATGPGATTGAVPQAAGTGKLEATGIVVQTEATGNAAKPEDENGSTAATGDGKTEATVKQEEEDPATAKRLSHNARVRLDRAMKDPTKVTGKMMEAWAVKGSREQMISSFAKHNSLAQLSVELMLRRSKRTAVSDLFRWLNRDGVKAIYPKHFETIIHTAKSRGVRYVRPDPNAPNEAELEQFYICVESKAEISEMLEEHLKVFPDSDVLVEMDELQLSGLDGCCAHTC
jgi:hypothetical protein